MDSILEAVELSLAAVIFCIAVYLLLVLAGKMDTYTDQALKHRTEIVECSYSGL